MPDDLDPETLGPELRGTARLVESALHAPPPPDQAEAQSRRLVEQLMEQAALSPKALREAVREQPHRPWWKKLLTRD